MISSRMITAFFSNSFNVYVVDILLMIIHGYSTLLYIDFMMILFYYFCMSSFYSLHKDIMAITPPYDGEAPLKIEQSLNPFANDLIRLARRSSEIDPHGLETEATPTTQFGDRVLRDFSDGSYVASRRPYCCTMAETLLNETLLFADHKPFKLRHYSSSLCSQDESVLIVMSEVDGKIVPLGIRKVVGKSYFYILRSQGAHQALESTFAVSDSLPQLPIRGLGHRIVKAVLRPSDIFETVRYSTAAMGIDPQGRNVDRELFLPGLNISSGKILETVDELAKKATLVGWQDLPSAAHNYL